MTNTAALYEPSKYTYTNKQHIQILLLSRGANYFNGQTKHVLLYYKLPFIAIVCCFKKNAWLPTVVASS
jgi:hypothetical protein